MSSASCSSVTIGYQRNSARVNVDQTIGSNWTVQVRTYYARSNNDGENFDITSGSGPWFLLTRVPGIVDLTRTDSLGRYFVRPNLQSSGTQNSNPLHVLNEFEREDKVNRFIGGLSVKYSPFTWMDAEGSFSYDNSRHPWSEFRDKG